MSDMMQDKMQESLSMANPADLAAMKQQGAAGEGRMAGVTESTTVRDFLGQLGIDVDGPVEQLKQFTDNEIAKGSPLNKAEALAGAPGGAPQVAPGPQPQQQGPGGPPGIEGLMQ